MHTEPLWPELAECIANFQFWQATPLTVFLSAFPNVALLSIALIFGSRSRRLPCARLSQYQLAEYCTDVYLVCVQDPSLLRVNFWSLRTRRISSVDSTGLAPMGNSVDCLWTMACLQSTSQRFSACWVLGVLPTYVPRKLLTCSVASSIF